jgi:hypothetical protein
MWHNINLNKVLYSLLLILFLLIFLIAINFYLEATKEERKKEREVIIQKRIYDKHKMKNKNRLENISYHLRNK